MLIFTSEKSKQNVLTGKNWAPDSLEGLLAHLNSEQNSFLGNHNVTVNFHELKTH